MTRVLAGLGVGLCGGATVGVVGWQSGFLWLLPRGVFGLGAYLVAFRNPYADQSVFDVLDTVGGACVSTVVFAAVVSRIVSLAFGFGLVGRAYVRTALAGIVGLGLVLGADHKDLAWLLSSTSATDFTLSLSWLLSSSATGFILGITGGAVDQSGHILWRFMIDRLTVIGSPRSREVPAWRRAGGARLLGALLRLLFGRWGEVKLEEWFADLAEIDGRWERTVYLLDLLFDLPRQTLAVQEREPKEPA